ncbi:MAG: VTT domain-containing protein [Polyangia bacterium]|jgi:membrane protein YqaA with SNARE-associated domain|nr:VTT domain-containing protein [Polyangia bacterium]
MTTPTKSPLDPEPPVKDQASDALADAGEESDARFLLRNFAYTILGMLVVIGLVVAARYLIGDQLAMASNWLTRKGGYAGAFLSTWAIDTFTLPVSPDIILAFVSHDGGHLNHGIALALISMASVAGGNTGFYLARWLGRSPWVQRRLAKSYQKGQRLFRRFGVWAVVIAGLTPVPFSIVCWLAGLYGMSPSRFFLATLSRIPRFVGWYYVFRLGFSI